MADKENNGTESFDAEIEEAAASLDADSSLSLNNDTKIKPTPSNNLPEPSEKNDSSGNMVEARDDPDILKTLAEGVS